MLFGGELAARAYDAWVSRGAPYRSEEFIRELSEYQKKSIDLVHSLDSLSEPELREGAQGVLRMLAFTVEAYHRKADGIRVNANYMIPTAPTDDLVQQALFTTRDRHVNSFRCFLQLVMWAEHSDGCPEDVLLPVELPSSHHPLLFGAPHAFVHQEMQVVGNTEDLWQVTQAEEYAPTRMQIAEFFKRQSDRFKSFASFPMSVPPGKAHTCQHPVMGVVNIDSNKTALLGQHRSNQAKLRQVLAPLIHILSYYVWRLHFLPHAGAEGAVH